MPSRVRVLFLCTANSCRSQMAEALLRHLGGDRFEALSAGSHPVGFVHPLAAQAMRRMGIEIRGQSSKSWDQFAVMPLDAVVTVCDRAAEETCPLWVGSPVIAHWSIPDPAQHFGTDAEREQLALRVAERLRTKIQGLVDLEWTTGKNVLVERLRFLGEI